MAGTGSTTPDEAMEKTMQFYKENGVAAEPKPMYTESDTKVLASADAAEIIRGGYEEVVEEVDRLAAMGDKMSPRDKAKFMMWNATVNITL